MAAARALSELSPARRDPKANLLPPVTEARDISVRVAVAVAIVFQVGLVATMVVAHQVAQRETVMGGDEVHARPGLAPVVVKEFGRALQARGQRAAQAVVAATTEEEWTLLEAFYTAPQEKTYARKSLATTLNNWAGEISRAREWAKRNQAGWQPPAGDF